MSDLQFIAAKLAHELSFGYGTATVSGNNGCMMLEYPSACSSVTLSGTMATFTRTGHATAEDYTDSCEYADYAELLHKTAVFLSYPTRHSRQLGGVNKIPPGVTMPVLRTGPLCSPHYKKKPVVMYYTPPELAARFDFLQNTGKLPNELFDTGRAMVALLREKHSDPAEIGLIDVGDEEWCGLEFHYPQANVYISLYASPCEYRVDMSVKFIDGAYDPNDMQSMTDKISAFMDTHTESETSTSNPVVSH